MLRLKKYGGLLKASQLFPSGTIWCVGRVSLVSALENPNLEFCFVPTVGSSKLIQTHLCPTVGSDALSWARREQ